MKIFYLHNASFRNSQAHQVCTGPWSIALSDLSDIRIVMIIASGDLTPAIISVVTTITRHTHWAGELIVRSATMRLSVIFRNFWRFSHLSTVFTVTRHCTGRLTRRIIRMTTPQPMTMVTARKRGS